MAYVRRESGPAHIRTSRSRVAEVAACNCNRRRQERSSVGPVSVKFTRRKQTVEKEERSVHVEPGRRRRRRRWSRVGTRIRWRMRFAEPIGRTGFRTCFAPYMHAGSSIMDGRAVRRRCLSSLFLQLKRKRETRNNPQMRLEFDLP